MKFLEIALLTFAAAGVQIATSLNEDRETESRSIVNGYDSPTRPFFVKVLSLGGVCGGSIIGARHVLTAAHCLQSPLGKRMIVIQIGDFSKPSKFVYSIGEAIVHEAYDKVKKFNDIALIKTYAPIPQSPHHYGIISLCTESSRFKHYPIAVSGMGLVNVTEKKYAKVLQEVVLQEVGTAKCRKKSDWFPSQQICLMGDEKDSCSGDSGGPAYPLMHGRPYCLYGVVSYGSSLCNGYGIYTRVSAYAEWIRRAMLI